MNIATDVTTFTAPPSTHNISFVYRLSGLGVGAHHHRRAGGTYVLRMRVHASQTSPSRLREHRHHYHTIHNTIHTSRAARASPESQQRKRRRARAETETGGQRVPQSRAEQSGQQRASRVGRADNREQGQKPDDEGRQRVTRSERTVALEGLE